MDGTGRRDDISFWDGFMGGTNSGLEVLEFLDPQALQIMAPQTNHPSKRPPPEIRVYLVI